MRDAKHNIFHLHVPTRLSSTILTFVVFPECYLSIIHTLKTVKTSLRELERQLPWHCELYSDVFSNSIVRQAEYLKHSCPHVIVSYAGTSHAGSVASARGSQDCLWSVVSWIVLKENAYSTKKIAARYLIHNLVVNRDSFKSRRQVSGIINKISIDQVNRFITTGSNDVCPKLLTL